MSKCLVTKYDGVVNNSNLVKYKEMRIKVPKVTNPTDGTQCIRLAFNALTTLKIIGNGYFTDRTLTKNYGKELLSNSSYLTNGDVYVSNDGVELSVSNKYAISYFAINFRNTGTNEFEFSLEDLKYSTALTNLTISSNAMTGDLSSLSNLTALTSLTISSNAVTGDLSSLSNLTALTSLTISSNAVTGDLSSLSNLTALTNLTISSNAVTGDLSSLSNLTALTNLTISSNAVTGNLSIFANMKNLKTVSAQVKITGDVSNLSNCPNFLHFSCSKESVISGDMSQLPAKCKHFNMIGENVAGLTWSTRPSSSSIVGMILPQWAPSNLDKVLQDLAACQKIQTDSDPAYYKRISLGGKRTSASDDAVATLQSKGFSVEVNK